MNKTQRIAEVVTLLREQEPVKFCKDCMYCEKPRYKFSQCTYSAAIKERDNEYYLVNGKKEKSKLETHYCAVMRKHTCGPKGQFFERRPLTRWQKLIQRVFGS